MDAWPARYILFVCCVPSVVARKTGQAGGIEAIAVLQVHLGTRPPVGSGASGSFGAPCSGAAAGARAALPGDGTSGCAASCCCCTSGACLSVVGAEPVAVAPVAAAVAAAASAAAAPADSPAAAGAARLLGSKGWPGAASALPKRAAKARSNMPPNDSPASMRQPPGQATTTSVGLETFDGQRQCMLHMSATARPAR